MMPESGAANAGQMLHRITLPAGAAAPSSTAEKSKSTTPGRTTRFA